MIEGARLLPWLKEAAVRNRDAIAPLLDCRKCKASYGPKERQNMGCGYEKRIDGAAMWQHDGYRGPDVTACVGYTAKLPGVIAVANLLPHWRNGSLVARCGGDVSPVVFDLIDEMTAHESCADAYAMREATKR